MSNPAPRFPTDEELRQRTIPKAHNQVYLHLKEVAEKLTSDYDAVKGSEHSSRTKESVKDSCQRKWRDAVAHAASPSGLNATPEQIKAARRRLDEGKALLSFLSDEQRDRAFARIN